MSNYPPGVTGFEPQIAGAEIERADTRTVPGCRMLGEVVIVATGSHAQTGVECDFEGGDVEGELNGDRFTATFYWDCPKCGTENDTEIDMSDDGPDPDDARDAAMFDV